MAANINADTSGGLKLTSDTSGVLELKSAGTTIATVNSTGLAMASGKVLASTGPTFSAHLSANQSIPSATFTKIAFNAELFDTNSDYNTGTYRFTPTVAGYYQINAISILSTVLNTAIITLYKNGAALARGTQQTNNALQTTRGMNISYLAYANGSSDYFEIYAYHTTGTTEEILGTSRFSYFQAYLARAA